MQSKEYLTPSEKLYSDIAKKKEFLTIKNFGTVFSILPNSERMLEQKEHIARDLLSNLKLFDLLFSERDFKSFSETPREFNRRLMVGSKQDKALDASKGSMMLINNLYGNYLVSIQIIDFLLKREHDFLAKNKELSKQNSELIKQLSDQKIIEEQKKVLETNTMQELVIEPSTPLALNEKEEQLVQQLDLKEEPVDSNNQVDSSNGFVEA